MSLSSIYLFLFWTRFKYIIIPTSTMVRDDVVSLHNTTKTKNLIPWNDKWVPNKVPTLYNALHISSLSQTKPTNQRKSELVRARVSRELFKTKKKNISLHSLLLPRQKHQNETFLHLLICFFTFYFMPFSSSLLPTLLLWVTLVLLQLHFRSSKVCYGSTKLLCFCFFNALFCLFFPRKWFPWKRIFSLL